MKYFFYDLETTGTDLNTCGIHQISGMIVIDGEIKEKFNFKVRPFDGALFSPKAMEIGNVTMEEIMQYPDMKTVYDQIIAILSKYVFRYDKKDKFFLVGYNILHFDNNFFRKWFEDCGDKYFGSWFWPNAIDIYSFATLYLSAVRPEMEDFKQGTVAKQLGIEVDPEKLHDALYDIEICHEIAKKVTVGAF